MLCVLVTTTGTAAVSTSTSLTGTTTTEICAFEEGMDQPDQIADEQIQLSPAADTPSAVRPTEESAGWQPKVPANNADLPEGSEDKPTASIDLTPSSGSQAPLVEKIVLSENSNVKKVTIKRIVPSGKFASTPAGESASTTSAVNGATASTAATGLVTTITASPRTSAATPGTIETVITTVVPDNGEILLPTAVRMQKIIIVLEEPKDETKEYKVKIGVQACFKLQGEYTANIT